MLVLTRKQKEEIRIGNNVTITILRIKGQSVRIGIDAPKEVKVIRGEIEIQLPEGSDVADALNGLAESAAPSLDTSRSQRFEASRHSNPSCQDLVDQASSAKLPCGATPNKKQLEDAIAEPNSSTKSTLAILAKRKSRGFSSN